MGKERLNFAYREIGGIYMWREDVKELRPAVKVI